MGRIVRHRSVRVAALVAAMGPLCPLAAAAQESSEAGQVVWTDVSLSDWGLATAAAIRFGRVALVEDEGGDRLNVYWLRESEPVRPSHPDRAEVPVFEGTSFIVAELDAGNRNRLGGFFNGFARAPSRAEVGIATAPGDRRALRVSCAVAESGYCGMWLHFFDLGRPPSERRYLDAGGFSTLSMWVRGEHGGERYEVSLADAAWERRQDARPLGELADFTPAGRIDTAWQPVVIPLDRLPADVSRKALASLVLRGLARGESAVYVRRIALSVEPGGHPALPARDADGRPSRPSGAVEATWIWNTDDILDDPSLRDELLTFLRLHAVERVFLQLPDDSTQRGAGGEILIDGDRLRPLIGALDELGIRVYALDGHPAHALRANHGRVLATLDNVIEYNRRSAPRERFAGVRHDIEPYLLAGFHGPARDTLLQHYLDLVAEVGRRTRTSGLVYGVDIPFWYDAPGEHSFEAVDVVYGGQSKPASHHIIDLADEVALMDYRTVAYGADGTVRHASGELAYAASRGVPVLVGLETFPLPDEALITFGGDPVDDLDQILPDDGIVCARGLAGDSVRIALVRPGHGHRSHTIRESLEHHGIEPRQALVWPIRSVIQVPGAKLSFAALGPESLERVMDDTRRELSVYPSFAGFAIHHVWSYADLLRAD